MSELDSEEKSMAYRAWWNDPSNPSGKGDFYMLVLREKSNHLHQVHRSSPVPNGKRNLEPASLSAPTLNMPLM
jgi:hypothetical protein